MISVEQLSKQISDLCPEDHLRSFLEENTRPDGRALDELRPIVLAKNVVQTADSSVLVRLGKTKVCVNIIFFYSHHVVVNNVFGLPTFKWVITKMTCRCCYGCCY